MCWYYKIIQYICSWQKESPKGKIYDKVMKTVPSDYCKIIMSLFPLDSCWFKGQGARRIETIDLRQRHCGRVNCEFTIGHLVHIIEPLWKLKGRGFSIETRCAFTHSVSSPHTQRAFYAHWIFDSSVLGTMSNVRKPHYSIGRGCVSFMLGSWEGQFVSRREDEMTSSLMVSVGFA